METKGSQVIEDYLKALFKDMEENPETIYD
jgi:hypothetical protein